MVNSENTSQSKISEKKEITIPEKIVIRELADKMNLPVAVVMAELMKNGIMSSMNEWIDFETAGIIAEDLGFQIKKSEEAVEEESKEGKILEETLKKDKQNLKPRPPVIVVVGHVDHGKTKLLDAIRETNVVDKEAGGITQSIGAYQLKYKDKYITLIDTPGHEAFSAMRSRGTKVADLAVLVVAADDGVKPQTKEALEIVKKAKIPFFVAINKIDKPEANIEKTKKELSELGLVPEEWGGKLITVPVSAKKKIGIVELLDMILLLAELEKKNIVAKPEGEAVGTVIDSHIDKGAGPQATVLVQTGMLKNSDHIIAGEVYGKIKTMRNWKGELVSEADPSMPVQILGLKGAPQVGDILHVTKDREEIKSLIKKQNIHVRQKLAQKVQPHATKKLKKEAMKEEKSAEGGSPPDADGPSAHASGGKIEKKKFKIILKTDTLGAREAILESLGNLKHPEVQAVITSKGLGNITETDILQADSTKSSLVGFNVMLTTQGEEVQKDRQVEIKTFTIIYELIDFVKEQLEKLLSPEKIQIDLGKIKILALFKTDKSYQIIGGKVISGKVENETKARITRSGKEIDQGKIIQLQSEKKNVREVLKDSECGLKIRSQSTIQEGDVLEVYREELKSRKLEL